MKKGIFWAAITIVAVLFFAVLAEGQDFGAASVTTINVRGTEVVTGVVIVSGQLSAPIPGQPTTFELQCNKGASLCSPLKPGTYVMVLLPKNRGMYVCRNVELYPNGADPETSNKIGAYCLIEK